MSWWPRTHVSFFCLPLENRKENLSYNPAKVAIARVIQLLYIWDCKERLELNLCVPSLCVSKFAEKDISRKKYLRWISASGLYQKILCYGTSGKSLKTLDHQFGLQHFTISDDKFN